VNLEDENDSPRGRLVHMRRMLDGDVALDDPSVGTHIDRCLGCRACETACPAGVPYGALLEETRAAMAPVRGAPLVAKVVLWLFAQTALLRVVLVAARGVRGLGWATFAARVLPKRLAFPFAMLASTAPHRTWRAPSGNKAHLGTAPDATPVALLTGCVMDGLFGHVHHATRVALTHNAYRVVDAPSQHCCGALHAHAGDLVSARELARRNIIAFEALLARHAEAWIGVNAAGCGAQLKQYAHLFAPDDLWHARAERIAARTRDVSELLAARGPAMGTRDVSLRVTHDPPCHQMHAQRLVQTPQAVLAAVPGLTVVALEDADQCCGSAGIYNLIEPAVSDAVLAPKLARVAETGAALVATGNPGCLMQLGAGLLLSGSGALAIHPVELLAASYAPRDSA
jgi:glycolate oxidase iron-sulfur subunit